MKKTLAAIAITATIIFASPAWAKTIYTTIPGYSATITLQSIEHLKPGNTESMIKGKKAFALPPGNRVYIEEIYGEFVRLRLVGSHYSIWTFMGAIKKL